MPEEVTKKRITISAVSDFEDWYEDSSGNWNLRVNFNDLKTDIQSGYKLEFDGIDDPSAKFFGDYSIQSSPTASTTIKNHDDFGLLSRPDHYQDEVHRKIFDKAGRGGTDLESLSSRRDLEFELDVQSITHSWQNNANAMNLPAMGSVSNISGNPTQLGGVIYQLNALTMDLGSQTEQISLQGVIIDRDNPPQQATSGGPHIRKQQLMDLARGQWAGNSGFTFENATDDKDFMTPNYWIAISIGQMTNRSVRTTDWMNNTYIAGNVASSGAVNITVNDSTGLEVGEVVKLDDEQMLISTIPDSTHFTVASGGREYNSTSAAAHTGTVTVYNHHYVERFWTGEEPSDDLRGKERLRNERRPGAIAKTMGSGFESSAVSMSTKSIVTRKSSTYEHNRYYGEEVDWRDGWGYKEGTGPKNAYGRRTNNPVLRDWDYKLHYEGRNRYRGAIKSLNFQNVGGQPDVWNFEMQFMVVKNETQIRHLSTKDDTGD